MKNLIKKSFVILILLVLPASTSAYEFTSKEKEEAAKRTRREIYELYDLYKETVSTPQQPEFGFIGYNGVCSTVTVDGQAVPLEEYVAGVIKHEIGSEHDNPELLKAQAIAARSFLLASKKIHHLVM